MTNQRRKVFLGSFIDSKTLDELRYLNDAAVCVDENGRIVAVEAPFENDTQVIEKLLPRIGWNLAEVEVEFTVTKENQFFFPGFIDTHIHAPQYPNVGIFGKTTLLDWLTKYTFPLESSLKEPARARQIYSRVVRKTLAHGTTCAAYYATIDVAATNLLADLCLAAGQRALVGRVCMNQLAPDWYRDESAAAALAATKESIAHIQKIDQAMALVRPVITPRFAPSCTVPLMRSLGQLAAETGLPVQTHISENKSEIALVKEMFPPSVTGAKDDTYAGVYDAFGLLTERTILAHAVHVTEGEADLIRARKAKISHCPCSNSSITSGTARIRWLLEKGIKTGLGTDVSGGYSPSVLEAARQAALVSRHVAMGGDDAAKLSVEEVLYLATRGGADVVGLGDRVGAFEVGRDFDAQLIGLGRITADGEAEDCQDSGDVDVFGWETPDEKVQKWLFNGDDRNTKMVWVKGKLVHRRT